MVTNIQGSGQNTLTPVTSIEAGISNRNGTLSFCSNEQILKSLNVAPERQYIRYEERFCVNTIHSNKLPVCTCTVKTEQGEDIQIKHISYNVKGEWDGEQSSSHNNRGKQG